ncbi:hypothetical protein HK100_004002, partial [Physocladia obscura]
MSDNSNADSPLEFLRAQHRRELKELQGKITSLKKSVASDKKKVYHQISNSRVLKEYSQKKELPDQIAAMEAELNAKHIAEIAALEGAAQTENSPETPFQSEVQQQQQQQQQSRKPNRQQQRKAKKAADFEEDRRLAALEAANTVNMKQIEEEAIAKLVVPLNRRVRQIIADGHCLYNALSDQYALVTEKDPLGYQYFRKTAADFMRQNRDEFLPFLVTDDGDMMTEEQYEMYCNNVESSGTWGGQLEIKAVSMSLKVEIQIVQMGSPILKIGEEFHNDKNPLMLSCWVSNKASSGDVVLHNLKLKREALDKFNLPVDVVEGFLGDLTLTIPWNDLKTKPVRVAINNVQLLVAPKAASDFDFDDVTEAERAFKAKMDRIEAAELLEKSAREAKLPDEKQNASFITQLVTKIIDNLQLSIQNIHVRYEDRTLGSITKPISFGITLSELSAFSTDEEWTAAFIHEEVGVIHKLCRLESLAVYFNNDDLTLGGLAMEESKQAFISLIAGENYIPEQNRYILKPVSGQGKITINKYPKVGETRYNASLEFNEFGFVIADNQYASALALSRAFTMYLKSQKYRQFRPPRSVPPSVDPLAWFKYAGICVLTDIQERNSKWKWAYFAQRRDDRIRYIRLYKLSKSTVANEFKTEEAELLTIMERKLRFEDIRLYRSIANAQLKKENAIRVAAEKKGDIAATVPKAPVAEATTYEWISSWWGSTQIEQSGQKEDAVAFSDEQMKKLMETIEYDPDAIVAQTDIPKDTVQISVEWCLRKGSLALKKEDSKRDFVSVVFDMLTAKADILPTSIRGNVSLGGMTVSDGTTPGTKFETLIQAIQDKGIHSDGYEKQPFFSLNFEHNPIDEHADEAFSLKMLPLQVVVNPAAINGVIDFFVIPSLDYDFTTTIKSVAKGITAQTRAGLEFALKRHRTVDAKIDIAAPIFVLPE